MPDDPTTSVNCTFEVPALSERSITRVEGAGRRPRLPHDITVTATNRRRISSALFRRPCGGRLKGLQRPLGVGFSSELSVGLSQQVMRLGVVGVQCDGLLEPAHAEIAPPELDECLPSQKEVARLAGVTLSRFGCQIEGALKVSNLDQEIGEVRIDDIVAGWSLWTSAMAFR